MTANKIYMKLPRELLGSHTPGNTPLPVAACRNKIEITSDEIAFHPETMVCTPWNCCAIHRGEESFNLVEVPRMVCD